MTTFLSDNYLVSNIKNFEPYQTFNCGQCFRFEKVGENTYEGIAFGRYIKIGKTSDGVVALYNTTPDEFKTLWNAFLDFDTNYKKISDTFSDYDIMINAREIAGGIRILRQDPWETLCSFIISQNNMIPRIKKIISSLSEKYGNKIVSPDGRIFYSFPTANSLYNAGESEIFALKTGFRAKYIFDAAKKIVMGEINLSDIYDMNTQNGAEYLMQIKGVGPKVAACVLLFAYHKLDSFPIDVWVKKIIEKYFNGETPNFGEYGGIAQQYLFYFERYIVSGKTD